VANAVDPINGVYHGDVSALHESSGKALNGVASTDRFLIQMFLLLEQVRQPIL